jgi:aminoglycoside 6-adenylyltransferase
MIARMRSSAEIKQMIMNLAEKDDRIRAVLLQGSRTNNKISPDKLQDYDVLLIVNEPDSFTSDLQWTSPFGEKLAWQVPDEMKIGPESKDKSSFHYLMLFTDGSRIDLTLFPKNRMKTDFRLDSLSVLWMDKDGLFPNIAAPGDQDYLIRKPTEKEFTDCCNEFWWVSTYISKGLLRKEITYAKAMMEGPVRDMFKCMIAWYIGTKTGFSVSFGYKGKLMRLHLEENEYNRILETYPDYKTENIWNALFLMTDLFSQYSIKVSDHLKIKLNLNESENVRHYLQRQYAERK